MTRRLPAGGRSPIAWYPLLVAIALPLNVFADAPIPLALGVRIFTGALCVGLVVTLLWSAALGRDRGALAASITVFGLVIAVGDSRPLLVVAALGLLLVETAWSRRGTMKVHVPWPKVTQAISAILAVFLVLQVVRMAWVRLPSEPPVPVPVATVAPDAQLPDIFVIVADGRGRSDVMRDRYGYDDAAFRDALTAAGLEPSDGSFANHSFTRYSMAVLLNGRPLSELGQDPETDPDDGLVYRATEHASIPAQLDAAGYETIVIPSGYDHVPLWNVDRYIDTGPRNETEKSFMLSTAIGQTIDRMTNLWVTDVIDRVHRDLSSLSEVVHAQHDSPQFVLMHLPVPHLPVVFNVDCSPRPNDGYTPGAAGRQAHAGNRTSIEVMAAQSQCTDSLVAAAIKDLVATRPQAVVIVLSDHGVEERLDWHAPDDQGIHDRMANTFWARAPGHPGLFPPDITLVNVFPILANAYLGTDLPLHSDDLWFGPTIVDKGFERYEKVGS